MPASSTSCRSSATPAASAQAVLGGWQIAGIVNISSGQPVSRMLVLTDNFRRGGFADLVGDINDGEQFINGVPYWFNPDAFAPPADGTFGNSGRAPFRQPGRHQWDINLSKNFYPTDTMRLQFRAEFINAFNQLPVAGGSERGRPRQHLHGLDHGRATSPATGSARSRHTRGAGDSARAETLLVTELVRYRPARTEYAIVRSVAIQDLKEQIARLPEQPGVYLYYNDKGETIYVGKARALRDRTRSYLGAYGMSPRHDALLDEAVRLEVIVTDSVVEALALENNLIKQRSPRYNILLRDDKNYPYLQLTTTEAFPRVLVARSVGARRQRVCRSVPAGEVRAPDDVADAQGVRHPVVQRGDHRLPQPAVPRTRHRPLPGAVRGHGLHRGALRGGGGRHPAVPRRPQRGAGRSAARRAWSRPPIDERFEEAAQLRDAMRTVQAVRERQQKMASAELGDRDVFGVKLGARGAVVQIFIVRGGRVIERVGVRVGSARKSGESEADGDRSRDSAVLCRPGSAAGDPRAGGAGRADSCSKTGWRRRPAARCASSCPSAATRRA